MQATIGIILFFGAVWFLLWLQLMYSGKHHLNSLPYFEYKLGNLAVRLQVICPSLPIAELLACQSTPSCQSSSAKWVRQLLS